MARVSSLDLRVRADFEQAMEECGGVRSAVALELSLDKRVQELLRMVEAGEGMSRGE